MSQLGQTEKNSVWANIFRVTYESGHRSIQSVGLNGASKRLTYCSKQENLFNHLVGALLEG
jgi:hypothetical protein